MEWGMYRLVADIARTVVLLPRDVLLSGTPRTVVPGDVVEVEGLGRLTNKVVSGPVSIRAELRGAATAKAVRAEPRQ
jgi:5-oxopent-3-ene-1,2,5-tricarboxylate decarboxylase/2-hydroxyhepta-2,4-diene-1,7-dioate isomerase